jgi:hypothetical protein
MEELDLPLVEALEREILVGRSNQKRGTLDREGTYDSH